jgi:hypothetical protein
MCDSFYDEAREQPREAARLEPFPLSLISSEKFGHPIALINAIAQMPEL